MHYRKKKRLSTTTDSTPLPVMSTMRPMHMGSASMIPSSGLSNILPSHMTPPPTSQKITPPVMPVQTQMPQHMMPIQTQMPQHMVPLQSQMPQHIPTSMPQHMMPTFTCMFDSMTGGYQLAPMMIGPYQMHMQQLHNYPMMTPIPKTSSSISSTSASTAATAEIDSGSSAQMKAEIERGLFNLQSSNQS